MSDHNLHETLADTDPRFFRAVQYVLGELSEAERDAFEAALPDDPSLCAAVAQATQLFAGVQAALAPTTTAVVVVERRESTRRDRWTVAAVAAAATGIAATLLATFTAPQSSSQAVQLVSLWRDAGRSEIGASAGESTFDADVAPASDDRIPPWMLAAVSLEHRPARSPLNEAPEPWEDN